MSIGSTTSASSAGSSSTAGNALGQVDIDEFLKLMIAELQNQDPLNPMDNAQMLEQISQIRSIGATDKLTSTLEAVLTGQNLSTAGSMIGKLVRAASVDGRLVEGKVESVSVDRDEKGGTKLRVQVEGRATAATQAEEANAAIEITAVAPGEEMNGVAIALIDDQTILRGQESAAYNSTQKVLAVQIRAGSSTASDVIRAISSNPALSGLFTARTAPGGDGTGLVRQEDSTILSAGGPQSVALDAVRQILPAN
jgi:flagellar basal-body rod modification protein FlgD